MLQGLKPQRSVLLGLLAVLLVGSSSLGSLFKFDPYCARLFYDLLTEENDQPPFLFLRARAFLPEHVDKGPDGHEAYSPANAPEIIFLSDPDNRDAPLKLLNRHGGLGYWAGYTEFYEHVYQKYKPKVRDEIINLLVALDKSSSEVRQTQVEVENYITKEVNGSARVVEGTKMRSWTFDEKDKAADDPHLPWEKMLAARNAGAEWLKAMETLRQELPNQRFFELGRYFLEAADGDRQLDKDAAYRLRKRAQKMIEVFLLKYFAERFKDGWMFGYCLEKETRDYFSQRYGYQTVAEFEIPDSMFSSPQPDGEPRMEYLIVVHHRDLRRKLQNRLGLPETPIQGDLPYGQTTTDLVAKLRSFLPR